MDLIEAAVRFWLTVLVFGLPIFVVGAWYTWKAHQGRKRDQAEWERRRREFEAHDAEVKARIDEARERMKL